MSEHKTVAIVKLNRGAWEAYREELITKFKAEGTLDTYSDEMVRTKDTTYLVKIVKVDPYLLDPILGFEGRCDVTDLKRFLDHQMEQLKPYLPAVAGVTADGETVTPQQAVDKLKVFTGKKLDPQPEVEPGKVETMPQGAQIGVDPAKEGGDQTVVTPPQSENLAPSSGDAPQTEGNTAPGAGSEK